jgi:hypothetical protein
MMPTAREETWTRRALWRTAGFAIPTGLLVTALHLEKERSFGEGLDGGLSSLWFVGLFLAGHLAAGRLSTRRPRRLSALAHLGGGASAAILGWGLLWTLWNLALPDGARSYALAINSLATLTVGFAAAWPGRGPAKPPLAVAALEER